MNNNQETKCSDFHAVYPIKNEVSSLFVYKVDLVLNNLEFVSLGFLGLFGGCMRVVGGLTAEQVQGAKI